MAINNNGTVDSIPIINNNIIFNSFVAIRNQCNTRPIIKNNIIQILNPDNANETWGIRDYAFSTPTVFNNTLINLTFGIVNDGYSHVNVTENFIYDSLRFGIINAYGSFGLIDGNVINGSKRSGIWNELNATNMMIINNNITNNYIGIDNYDCTLTLRNNTIMNNVIGLNNTQNAWLDIIDNKILNNSQTGILNTGLSWSKIKDNSIWGNGAYGIANFDDSWSTIENNSISNSTCGIFNSAWKMNEISNNEIFANSADGISALKKSDLIISSNTINKNGGFGLNASDNSRLILNDNDISDNGGGVSMKSGCTGTLFCNSIQGGEFGIKLDQSSPSITDTLVSQTGTGVLAVGSSPRIMNMTVYHANTCAVKCEDSSNPTIIDSTIDSEIDKWNFWVTGNSHPVAINSTFNSQRLIINDTSSLCVQWNLQVELKDSKERALENANISFFGRNVTRVKTDKDGLTPWFSLEEMTVEKDNVEKVDYTIGINVENDSSVITNFTINRTQRLGLRFDFQPMISSIPEQYINEDEPTSLDLAQFISDKDDDAGELEISLSGESASNKNVSVIGTRLIFNYSLPKTEDMIYFEVNDGARKTSSYLLVHVLPVNDLPQFLDPGPLILTENETYMLDLSKYICDEDNLFENLRIEFTSDYAQRRGSKMYLCYPNGVTNDSILITVTDKDNGMCQRVLNITINPVNDPPELTLPEITPTEDIEYTVDLSHRISDIDTPLSNIRIQCSSEFCNVTGFVLRFKYPEGIKYDNFTILVSDGVNSTSYYLEITVYQVNDPPTLLTVPSINVIAGSSYTINFWDYITDPDTPKSKISLKSTTDGVTITGFNVTYQCSPQTPSGQINITICLSDEKNSPLFNIPVNITAAKSQTQFIKQIEIWLYIFVPIAIIATIAGILTYRRIRYGWYEIKKVLVINQDGRMIAHFGESGGQMDEFLLSGMLTAIQQFIEEVMKAEKAGSTREFLHEKMRIVIERGQTIYLAVFLNGYTTEGLKKRMKSIVENIERKYSAQLAQWDGNLTSAPFIGEMMAELQTLSSKK